MSTVFVLPNGCTVTILNLPPKVTNKRVINGRIL